MTLFRTPIDIPKPGFSITHNNNSLLIGSCFSDNIGNRMKEVKFPVLLNPFGVLYNPMSVKQCVEFLTGDEQFEESMLQHRNGLWFSYYHHGSFSHHDKTICIQNINTALSQANVFFKESKYLFVTFGTAWVYRYRKSGHIVSNCHKVPAAEFDRFMLDVPEVVAAWKPLMEKITRQFPGLKVIFTVSPVRHLKDGMTGNLQSKSVLVLSVMKLLEMFPETYYFPSYEMMMDDLRDYRFYAQDMLHPSDLAIDYIWEKFSETFFDKDTIDASMEIKKIKDATNHRPFNTKSSEYPTFIKKHIEKIIMLQKKWPNIDFSDELGYFQRMKV